MGSVISPRALVGQTLLSLTTIVGRVTSPGATDTYPGREGWYLSNRSWKLTQFSGWHLHGYPGISYLACSNCAIGTFGLGIKTKIYSPGLAGKRLHCQRNGGAGD